MAPKSVQQSDDVRQQLLNLILKDPNLIRNNRSDLRPLDLDQS